MEKLLVIATEPAPYKIDQFNAFAKIENLEVTVIYARQKDWNRDACHDFKQLPNQNFRIFVYLGRGLVGQIKCSMGLILKIFLIKPTVLLVSGYDGLPYLVAILMAIVLKIKYGFWVDQFNNNEPVKYKHFGKMVRTILRKIVFRSATKILVCGKLGKESAVNSGCVKTKIIDFPYVVDPNRLLQSGCNVVFPGSVPAKKDDVKRIFFSGRLIPRKGLDVFLSALEQLRRECVCFDAVIEGDGPLRLSYEKKVSESGLGLQTFFVGFRQMHEHAILLCNSDIVVVPSRQDSWGIMVHEGMVMCKPVCASDAVGSAVDRIEHGKTGLMFPSGDWRQLAEQLIMLIRDETLYRNIVDAGKKTADFWTAERNAAQFISAMDT